MNVYTHKDYSEILSLLSADRSLKLWSSTDGTNYKVDPFLPSPRQHWYAVSAEKPSSTHFKIGPYTYPIPLQDFNYRGVVWSVITLTPFNYIDLPPHQVHMTLGLLHKTEENARAHQKALSRFVTLQRKPQE